MPYSNNSPLYKDRKSYGAHSNHYSEVGNQDRPGFMTNLYRFMSSAQEAADKYGDYKYNQTYWRAIRP